MQDRLIEEMEQDTEAIRKMLDDHGKRPRAGITKPTVAARKAKRQRKTRSR